MISKAFPQKASFLRVKRSPVASSGLWLTCASYSAYSLSRMAHNLFLTLSPIMMIFDPQENTKSKQEWIFFKQTILPCLHGNPCCIFFSLHFQYFRWQAWQCGFRSLFTPFIHSIEIHCQKGEQSHFVYADHVFFFLLSWPICIAFCPFSTVSFTCLISLFGQYFILWWLKLMSE